MIVVATAPSGKKIQWRSLHKSNTHTHTHNIFNNTCFKKCKQPLNVQHRNYIPAHTFRCTQSDFFFLNEMMEEDTKKLKTLYNARDYSARAIPPSEQPVLRYNLFQNINSFRFLYFLPVYIFFPARSMWYYVFKTSFPRRLRNDRCSLQIHIHTLTYSYTHIHIHSHTHTHTDI